MMIPAQQPIHSGFGHHSTAREVLAGLDLKNQVAIVTGGYSGLGLETTRALAEAGAHVIVPARSPQKAKAALAGLAGVEQAVLDLADPASIDRFAAGFLASGRPLHVLINNAAIMACPLTRDSRGFEAQFATNHLGHFQLTARLWPAMRMAGKARVVSLSSIGHRRAPVNLDDPSFERGPYDKWEAYGRAKSANALFAVGLDARARAFSVRAFAVHPGGIMTDLQRFMAEEEKRAAGWIDADGQPVEGFKTPQQGAATSVWCATSPRLEGKGGLYCEDCDIAQMLPADAPGWTGVRPWAIDPMQADGLWRLSEAMTGVSFGF